MSKSFWQIVNDLKKTLLDLSLKLDLLLPSSELGIWKFRFQILESSAKYAFHLLNVQKVSCQKDFENLSSEVKIELFERFTTLNQKIQQLFEEIKTKVLITAIFNQYSLVLYIKINNLKKYY